MKKVYICSPYKGNIERNIAYARELCKKELLKGNFPIAPHLYLTQFLNDDIEEERKQGLEIGITILEQCDDIAVGLKYGISSGMKKEIEYWKNKYEINR